MADSIVLELCKALGNKLLEEGSLLLGVPEEAENLQQKLRSIQAVLADAERQEVMKDSVKSWIRELKDVAYDVEDVLDDWTIAEMLKQDEPGTSKRGNKAKGKVCLSCLPTPCLCFKQAERLHRIAYAIIEINGRLDGIAKRKHGFSFETFHSDRNETIERPLTTQFGKAHVIPCQENARDTLIQKLLRHEFLNNYISNDVPIISLVGMGGMGKTTLARLVCNDDIVKGHFPKPIWVCVSDIFDKMNIARVIAGALQLNVGYLTDLQNVLQKIVDSITGQKFFLVLDDVWTEREEVWSDILSCLGKGDPRGSRILLTTRSDIVAQKMRSCFTFRVNNLSEEESWSLFSYFAFFGKTEEDRERVKDIARELVGKCKGLPLALEVLGRFMHTKRCTVSVWENVLRSRVWEIKSEKDIFPSLVLSYLELPSAAKRCFVFCSVFPKDSIILKDDLIRLWMAQGYLGGTNQMEAFGEDCFNTLVMRSFFQLNDENYSTDIAVTMHDILHDLAQYISNGEIDILDPTIEKCKDRVRHLSFSGILSESKCSSLGFVIKEQLRSLFASIDSELVLKEICSNTLYLRVLELRLVSSDSDDYGLKNIAKLVHLRYLCLASSNLIVLPEEICDLHFLQTLDLRRCTGIKKFPKEIGRLTCLRHLLIDNNRHMNSLPKGLGKLRSLQTLSYFPCSNVDRKDCSSLADLGDLNDLRGHIWLKNLNKVAQVNEATTAQLHMKKQIRQLTLEFGEGNPLVQSDVLEALEPAKENIVFLEISGYRGRRCPRWITQLRYLKEIQLKGVDMDSLPELGTLLFLEKLCVCDAIEVKHVGAEFFRTCTREAKVFFQKLTSLEFINMPWWEHWEIPKEILNTRIAIMPLLHCLTLRNCGLRSLPRFLEYAPLARLEAHCRLLPVISTEDGYPRRWSIGNIVLPQCLKEINTSWVESEKEAPANQPAEGSEEVQQRHLYIHLSEIDSRLYWRNYSVPKWMTDHLTYLRDITLSHVTDECLPSFGLMASLEKLTIMFAVKVEKVGNEFLGISNSTNDEANKGRDGGGELATCILFPRLKKLHFAWMPWWKEWEGPAHQNNLIIMPSLCHLKINECKELNCLPQFLEVVDLKKLEVDAGPEGSMPKIQNSTTSYAKNELSPRTDIREISLSHIRHGWVLDWSKYCVGLRELQLDNCDAASLAALEVFPSLEVLSIGYCPEIRRLGKEVILISSLKELHLSYLRNLEEWEDPSPPQLETSSSSELTEISRHGNKNNSTVITTMPQFRILSILYCPKLKALPDFLRSIPLESLSIKNCWAIEAWCAIEAGEDWRNWTANIPQFNFTGGHLGIFPMSALNVEVPELNRDNYKVWKERILRNLSTSDLCFAIENPKLTITDDSTEAEIATHEQWVKANRMSCIYIKTKMSPSTRGSVDHHHDVNDLLKAIDEQFIDSDRALASKLIMEFWSMKLTTVKGVREHIMKMRDLAAKLKTLKEVDMSEASLVHLTLNSLPEEYTSFKDTYHTQRDKWSINELITMCVQEEERLLMDHVKECDDDYQG